MRSSYPPPSGAVGPLFDVCVDYDIDDNGEKAVSHNMLDSMGVRSAYMSGKKKRLLEMTGTTQRTLV